MGISLSNKLHNSLPNLRHSLPPMTDSQRLQQARPCCLKGPTQWWNSCSEFPVGSATAPVSETHLYSVPFFLESIPSINHVQQIYVSGLAAREPNLKQWFNQLLLWIKTEFVQSVRFWMHVFFLRIVNLKIVSLGLHTKLLCLFSLD